MDVVKIVLYVFLTSILFGLTLFNIVYSVQLKKVEEILSLKLPTSLNTIQKLEIFIPAFILLFALAVTIYTLIT